MRALTLSSQFALSMLMIHIGFRLVNSERIILPLKGYWRIFLEDNKPYLESISSQLVYLAENEETRCPLHLPGDVRQPAEGPDESSLAYMLSVLDQASATLRQFGNDAILTLAINPTRYSDPVLESIQGWGFDSMVDLLTVSERLRVYSQLFREGGRGIQQFLKWARKPMRKNGEIALLKLIYSAKLISAIPGMIPGINENTPAVELRTEAKDAFVAKVEEAAQVLLTGGHNVPDEAIAWIGSLALPPATNAALVPDGPWITNNLGSVVLEIGNFFQCWLKPVESMVWALHKLTQPPEVQPDLEIESRPEGNILTGEPEGWEWEHGTDAFPGLNQNIQLGVSTASNISTVPMWEEPHDINVGLNQDLRPPVPTTSAIPISMEGAGGGGA
ncbi:hypothetical protein TWF281_005465 [Arthrobotrys megalospora]